MTKKPTKWQRVLAWLDKKRKDRRKTTKLRREPKTRDYQPPVLTLDEAFTFKAAPKRLPSSSRIVGYRGEVPVVREHKLQARIDRHERWLRTERTRKST